MTQLLSQTGLGAAEPPSCAISDATGIMKTFTATLNAMVRRCRKGQETKKLSQARQGRYNGTKNRMEVTGTVQLQNTGRRQESQLKYAGERAMKNALGMLLVLSGVARCEWGDDTLEFFLSKSQLVVVGEIAGQVGRARWNRPGGHDDRMGRRS